MRLNFHYVFCFVVVILLCISKNSLAQESELLPQDTTLLNDRAEENSYSPIEEESRNQFSNSGKDSVYTKVHHQKVRINSESSKSAERHKEEAEEETSILSFNFIYYIIKKFKFSDIVDK